MRSSTPILREPSPGEARVIARLLGVEFPGAPEVRNQAAQSTVQVQDYGDVLVLAFKSTVSLPLARVDQRIPVEAEAPDVDGVMIHFLLHVVGGVIKEVEVFREDSGKIRRFPKDTDLEVVVN